MLSKLPQDFIGRFDPVTESGCWLWIRGCTGAGYGAYQIKPSRIVVGAHRFAYETIHGPVPKYLHIDHLCRVRCCVNPDHMEVVTRKVNILRGMSPQAINARKQVCHRGHPLTPDNVYLRKGMRRCQTCHRDKATLRRALLKKDGA